MTYNPVGWFEIPVTDMNRAIRFYQNLFDIKLEKHELVGYEMMWFPMDTAMKGISGALMKGDGYVPRAGGPVLYFTCPDIDLALQMAHSMGAQTVLPKKDLGEYGHIAWLLDSEGNTIALHTAKKE